MNILFSHEVKKYRKKWCKYRIMAIKQENFNVIYKLDDVEELLRPLEKQESEITKSKSRTRQLYDIRKGLKYIEKELKENKKIRGFHIFINRLYRTRKKWCKIRYKILNMKPNEDRDKLLDKLDSIEDDFQTIEIGERENLKISDRNRILKSVKKSLSKIKKEIKENKIMEKDINYSYSDNN